VLEAAGAARSARWSLATLLEKLVKIGPWIVCYGRYLVFQLAGWRCRTSCSPTSCAELITCEDCPWRRP